MEDIATGESEAPLQVQRREHLLFDNEIPKAGRVFFDHIQAAIRKRFPQFIPIPIAQGVRRILNENPHDVLAGRRKRRIVHGRNGHLQHRRLRGMPILGVIPGALYIFERRADMHGRPMLRTLRARQSAEIRQAVQCQINLAGCAFAAVLDNRIPKIRR